MTSDKIKDEEQVTIAVGDTSGLHVYVIQGNRIYSPSIFHCNSRGIIV